MKYISSNKIYIVENDISKTGELEKHKKHKWIEKIWKNRKISSDILYYINEVEIILICFKNDEYLKKGKINQFFLSNWIISVRNKNIID